MTSQTIGKPRLILTWILRVLLGVIFLGIGIEKLTGTMGTIPFFDAMFHRRTPLPERRPRII